MSTSNFAAPSAHQLDTNVLNRKFGGGLSRDEAVQHLNKAEFQSISELEKENAVVTEKISAMSDLTDSEVLVQARGELGGRMQEFMQRIATRVKATPDMSGAAELEEKLEKQRDALRRLIGAQNNKVIKELMMKNADLDDSLHESIGEVEKRDKQIYVLQKEINSFKRMHQSLSDDAFDAISYRAEAQRDLASFKESHKTAVQTLRGQLKDKSKQVTLEERKCQDLSRELTNSEAELTKRDDKIDIADENLAKVTEELGHLKTQNKQLSQRITILDAEVGSTRRANENLSTEVGALKAERASLINTNANSVGELSSVRDAEKLAQQTNSVLSEKVKRLESEKANLEAEMRTARKTSESLSAEISSVKADKEKADKELSKKVVEIANLQGERDSAQQTLSDVREELGTEKVRAQQAETLADTSAKDFESFKAKVSHEIAELKAERDSAQQTMSAERETLKAERSRAQETERALNESVASIKSEKEEVERARSEMDAQVVKLKAERDSAVAAQSATAGHLEAEKSTAEQTKKTLSEQLETLRTQVTTAQELIEKTRVNHAAEIEKMASEARSAGAIKLNLSNQLRRAQEDAESNAAVVVKLSTEIDTLKQSIEDTAREHGRGQHDASVLQNERDEQCLLLKKQRKSLVRLTWRCVARAIVNELWLNGKKNELRLAITELEMANSCLSCARHMLHQQKDEFEAQLVEAQQKLEEVGLEKAKVELQNVIGLHDRNSFVACTELVTRQVVDLQAVERTMDSGRKVIGSGCLPTSALESLQSSDFQNPVCSDNNPDE